jgi:hypothetical protein
MCKWVYKRLDRFPRVENTCFKSCLVNKGFTQREGVDVNEVFSLVMKHNPIQI